MKKSLRVAGLGVGFGLALGLSSASASAVPMHESHGRAHGKAPKEDSARGHQPDLRLWSQGSHGSDRAKVRSNGRGDLDVAARGLGGWTIAPSSASSATSAVPEPSALLLFGVGCLITCGVLSRPRGSRE